MEIFPKNFTNIVELKQVIRRKLWRNLLKKNPKTSKYFFFVTLTVPFKNVSKDFFQVVFTNFFEIEKTNFSLFQKSVKITFMVKFDLWFGKSIGNKVFRLNLYLPFKPRFSEVPLNIYQNTGLNYLSILKKVSLAF